MGTLARDRCTRFVDRIAGPVHLRFNQQGATRARGPMASPQGTSRGALRPRLQSPRPGGPDHVLGVRSWVHFVDRVRLSPVVGDDRTRSAPERLGARLAGRVPVGPGTTGGDGESAGSGRTIALTGTLAGPLTVERPHIGAKRRSPNESPQAGLCGRAPDPLRPRSVPAAARAGGTSNNGNPS